MKKAASEVNFQKRPPDDVSGRREREAREAQQAETLAEIMDRLVELKDPDEVKRVRRRMRREGGTFSATQQAVRDELKRQRDEEFALIRKKMKADGTLR